MGGGGGGERRDNGGQVRQKITYSKKLGELLWSLLQKVGKGGVTPQKVALLPSPSRPTQNTIIQIIKTPLHTIIMPTTHATRPVRSASRI